MLNFLRMLKKSLSIFEDSRQIYLWRFPFLLQGDLVYANYARVDDFFELEKLGINVTDKIVIARYGKIYRGDKVGKIRAVVIPHPVKWDFQRARGEILLLRISAVGMLRMYQRILMIINKYIKQQTRCSIMLTIK